MATSDVYARTALLGCLGICLCGFVWITYLLPAETAAVTWEDTDYGIRGRQETLEVATAKP
jgi:hypothetical protein